MNADATLWEDITGLLLSRIETEGMKSGDPFLSADKIASLYNVSNITGRRVLAELAKKGIIAARGKKFYLKRNPAMKLVHLLIHDTSGLESLRLRENAEIYKGIVSECSFNNLDVKAVDCEYFLRMPLDGRIFVIISHNLPDDREVMERLRSPQVSFACCHLYEKAQGAATARMDFVKGASLAVRHLIQRGRRRIALLTSHGPWFAGRFEGYYSALKEAGMSLDLSLVKESSNFDHEGVRACLSQLFDSQNPPDGIFAATDKHALQAIEFCKARGVAIPERLSIVGYDNIPEAGISSPPLSTIESFPSRCGSEAVRLLIESQSGDKFGADCLIEPELIAGGTS